MDRLTNIGTKGELYITDNDETRHIGQKEAAYAKLKEYEDAEEAGLLVRLPCKVGDTLYRIYTTYEELETGVDELTYAPRVEAVVVEDICLSRSARYITVLTERLGWHIRYALSDVKKYLFSTAEEAERALKAEDRHE